MEFVDQNENQVEKTVMNEAQPEIPSSVNDGESTENVDEEVGQYCVVIPPETDETAKDKAPVDRIVIPADVTEIHEDDEQVYIIGTRDGKVTQIVGLEKVKQLKVRASISISFLIKLIDKRLVSVPTVVDLAFMSYWSYGWSTRFNSSRKIRTL